MIGSARLFFNWVGAAPSSGGAGVVTAGGTPLAWRVRVLPLNIVATANGSSGTSSQVLPLRASGPNRVIVDSIEDPEVPTRITPTAVTWRADTVAGVSLGSGSLTQSGTDWRVTITPVATMRSLTIGITAPDGSSTTVRYPIVLES